MRSTRLPETSPETSLEGIGRASTGTTEESGMSYQIQVHRLEVANCACGASLLIPDRMRENKSGRCPVCGSKIEISRDHDGYDSVSTETRQTFEAGAPDRGIMSE